MANQEVKTDEFDVVSKDGRQFHINVFTTMIETGTMRELNSPPKPGIMKSAVTDEGYSCNQIDDDNWEIVSHGPLLRVTRV